MNLKKNKPNQIHALWAMGVVAAFAALPIILDLYSHILILRGGSTERTEAFLTDISEYSIPLFVTSVFSIFGSLIRILHEGDKSLDTWDHQPRQFMFSIFCGYVIFSILNSNIILKLLYKNIENVEFDTRFLTIIVIGSLSGYFARDIMVAGAKRLRSHIDQLSEKEASNSTGKSE